VWLEHYYSDYIIPKSNEDGQSYLDKNNGQWFCNVRKFTISKIQECSIYCTKSNHLFSMDETYTFVNYKQF